MDKYKIIDQIIRIAQNNDSHYIPTLEVLEEYSVRELNAFLREYREEYEDE